MICPAVIARGSFDTSAAHPYGLFIDGLDVIKDPAGNYGAVPGTIEMTEAGPSAVSSLVAEIEDELAAVSIADGATVLAYDFTRDIPLFRGNLEARTYRPAFGGQGRIISLQAFGQESLLDTIIVPSLTIGPAGNASSDGQGWAEWHVVQAITAYAPLVHRARAGIVPPADGEVSSRLEPVGTWAKHRELNVALVLDGMTIREAWNAYLAAADPYIGGPAVETPPEFFSVDPYGNVRLFAWGGGGFYQTLELPVDTVIIMVSTATGAVHATNLAYAEDHSPGAITNAVYVKGAAAASTGWVVGDTRTGRREASTTTAGTTEADKQKAGTAILVDKGTPAGRGSLTLEDYTPVDAHPGGKITITDPSQGWVARVFLITEITRRLKPGLKQDWDVSFMDGVDVPAAGPVSSARFMRRRMAN